jgi:hypothetical protein
MGIAVAACSDSTGPSGRARERSQARFLRGVDREFAEIARTVPGFGGLSRASDGSAVLLLTDPSQAAAAKQAVAARSRRLRGIDLSRVQVRGAKFDYVRLTDWRARLREELDVPGLVYLDIDESNNQLRVGVRAGTSHAVVESAITNLDVPADAVTIADAEPVRFSGTLRDRMRATVSGLQIAFTTPDIPAGSFFICTLGFNARQATSSNTYLVSASHCSGTQGGVQHTQMFQPTPGPDNLVAVEHLDPDLFVDGCYPHRRCRFSDAALSRYLPGVDANVGLLARPTFRGLTAGPLVIDDVNPLLTVIDKQPFSVMGQTLDKLGRTTGWTVGTVAATCVDVFVTDTDVTLLCQDAMLSGVGGGDSGSPIFESQVPFTSDVTLYGILWGSANTSFGPLVFFSPLENIESELGELMVAAP